MSRETLGPPFNAPWQRLTSDPPPPEFWSAARIDPNTGELVLQLGIKPHPLIGNRIGAFVFAGFRQVWTVPADGSYTFSGHFEPHQITVRSHGAAVYTQAILSGQHGFDLKNVVSNTPVQLTFQISEKKGTQIVLAYAAIIRMTFTADQTATAEILARAGTLVRDFSGAAVAAAATTTQLHVRSGGPLDQADLGNLLVRHEGVHLGSSTQQV